MVRDLQDDHYGSDLDDFLLRRTSKSVTLGCLGMRQKNRMKEQSSRFKEKGQGR